MRTMILAGAAVLALAVPAAAQETTTDAEMGVETAVGAHAMTPSQQTSYDAWPADRQASYDGWSAEIQEYFWTLTPDQQTGWWALTDEQRQQVYAMTPGQRTAAWAQISAQLNGAPPPATGATGASTTGTSTMGTGGADTAMTGTARTGATTAAPSASATTSTGNMRFVESETVQTAPAPKGEYPICKGDVQDGCINPRAAGENYGNVPLDYWPGKPASEIDEPLPAKKPKT